jgi:hypothetical protein
MSLSPGANHFFWTVGGASSTAVVDLLYGAAQTGTSDHVSQEL